VPTGAPRLGRGDRERAQGLCGRPLPVTRFRAGDGSVLDLAALRGRRVLLVVLRGFTDRVCVNCLAQTAELVPAAAEFAKLEAEVVVLYPGPKSKLDAFVAACADEFADSGLPPYRVVYDPDLELAQGLGVIADLARPSALILDRDGIVRWAYIAESDANIADRPPITEIVRALAEVP
jgi:peroxiredoxin